MSIKNSTIEIELEEFLTGENPDDARCKILKAATEAFAMHGYYGASIRDISKLCGLKQPSIYHHFSSKENLFRVVLACSYERLLRYLQKHSEKGQGFLEDVLSICKSLHDFNSEHENQLLLIASLVFSSPSSIRQFFLSELTPLMDRFMSERLRPYETTESFEEKMHCIRAILRSYTLQLALPERANSEVLRMQTHSAIEFVLARC